jgi:UDP-N-acetylmuramate dehydrogenase
LVLVNYGSASGVELVNLARRIQGDILQRFGVSLEMEPNLY